MVFFTCNNCGESVKKISVEKHYNTRCFNNPKNVSCMDCQKDFHGEEYVAHTKCISEAEKYSGKNYVAKENKNSGQKRQESWMDVVRSILESTENQMPAQTRNIFQRLKNYDNVPRKKAKFQNFVVNCLRIKAKDAQPVWEVLEKELEKMKKVRQQEMTSTTAAINESKDDGVKQTNGLKRNQGNKEEEEIPGKKKKANESKLGILEVNAEPEIKEEADIFQWSTVLEKIVAKHSEGLPLDKLKKKLLKKYKSKLNVEELSEKQQTKFEKKFSKTLKKCPSVQVDGDRAKPC